MKRGAYVAAANRAQFAVRQLSAGRPRPRRRCSSWSKAYERLGMPDLREDADRVMRKNFPDSQIRTGKLRTAGKWWQLWNW